jgi:hypothetical protein
MLSSRYWALVVWPRAVVDLMLQPFKDDYQREYAEYKKLMDSDLATKDMPPEAPV